VWAIFSTLDPRVLQFKPGLLLTPDLCAELLDRVEVAIAAARDDASASPGGRPPGTPRSPLRAERRLGEHPPAAGLASPTRQVRS
jgi:hypothetical protein